MTKQIEEIENSVDESKVFHKLSKQEIDAILSGCDGIKGLKPFSRNTLAALMYIHKNTKAEESGILYMDIQTIRETAGVKLQNLYTGFMELENRGIIDYKKGSKRAKGQKAEASSFIIHFETLGKPGIRSKHWEGYEMGYETEPVGNVEGKETNPQSGTENTQGNDGICSKHWEGYEMGYETEHPEGNESEGYAQHNTAQYSTEHFIQRLNYLLDLLKISRTFKGSRDNILTDKSNNNLNKILDKIIQQVTHTREENLTLREELAKVKLENMELKQQLCEARQQPSLQSEEEDSPTLAVLTPELRANTELMKTIRMFDKDAAARRRDESMQTPVCDEDYEGEQW